MLIARFWNLSAERRRLLAEAVGELAAARLATKFMPFARLVRWSSGPLGRADPTRIEDAVWAVRAAAARVPFRAVCLQQSVALQRMLRRRGCDARLHYGLASGARLEAHAWVTLGATALIGGEEAARFREVAAWP